MIMPKKIASLISAKVGNETLVYSPGKPEMEAHCLSEIGSLVFELCDGSTDSDSVLAVVVKATGKSEDECRAEIAAAVEGFETLGFLEEEKSGGMSRRDFFKYGQLAAAGVAVMTMALPSPAAAGNSDTCTDQLSTIQANCNSDFGDGNTAITYCTRAGASNNGCPNLGGFPTMCAAEHRVGVVTGVGFTGEQVIAPIGAVLDQAGTTQQQNCTLARAATGGVFNTQYWCCSGT